MYMLDTVFELFSSNLVESIRDEKSCNPAVIQTFSYNSVFHHSDNKSSLHCAVMLTRVTSTGAALLDNNEATAKSTSQDGGMAVNFG